MSVQVRPESRLKLDPLKPDAAPVVTITPVFGITAISLDQIFPVGVNAVQVAPPSEVLFAETKAPVALRYIWAIPLSASKNFTDIPCVPGRFTTVPTVQFKPLSAEWKT